MTAILRITDGTTVVDLLSGGFYLDPENGWTPQRLQYKGGGVFSDNPMADGRSLVDSRWASVVETFNLIVSDTDPDAVIRDTQELGRLMEKATAYWKNRWQNGLVWIEAQAECETNIRYATIKAYQTPQDGAPFTATFMNELASAMDDFVLVAEHEPWQDVAPGSSTCVELTAYKTIGSSLSIEAGPEESADDAVVEHNGATINLLTFPIAGTTGGATDYDSGIRFKNLNIPAGATITSAYITFTASANLAGAPCPTLFFGELTVAPAAYTTYANFTGRALTVANVAWDVPAWVLDTAYNSPDLSAIINEIIALPGWAAGNDIAIQWQNNVSANYRRSYGWDNLTNYPVLHVIYTTDNIVGISTPTCNDYNYVANKYNESQLTHVFVYDAAPGVYSVNLLNAPLPFPFYPAVPAANDIVYFGVDTSGGDTGPFHSLIFDIGTVQADLTITWEYWNGAWVAWGANVTDKTRNVQEFDIAGVNSVVFHVTGASDWTTTAVNGVTGYWVRAIITAVGGAPTPPYQANRKIYTVTWPGINVYDENPQGDIDALVKYKISSCSSTSVERLIVALRSASRGTFQPYLNISDEQNPSGISASVIGAAAPGYTTFVAWIGAPSGRAALYNPAATTATFLERCRIQIDITAMSGYVGNYRLFLRVHQVGGAAGQIQVRARVLDNSATYWTSDAVSVTLIDSMELLDLGAIKVGYDPMYTDAYYWYLVIDSLTSSVTPDLYFVDAILMPTDEWIGEVRTNNNAMADQNGWLNLDAVTYPKNKRSVKPYSSTAPYLGSSLSAPWLAVMGYPFMLHANTDQNVFFLSANIQTLTPMVCSSTIYHTLAPQAWRVQRYLSMRGNR